MKRYVDEVEAEAHRGNREAAQIPMGPLFEAVYAPLHDVPKRQPAGPAEQRILPIDNSTEARYTRWRETEGGRLAFAAVHEKAMQEVDAGATRIGSKALTEWARGTLRLSIDNRFTPYIGRELADREPELKKLMEFRERTAA